MSNLPSVIDIKNLEDRLDEATDIDESIESPDGGEMELPESAKQSILETNVSDALADYISDRAVEMPEVRETKLMYGSGDTGRQSQLYLKPKKGVSKDQMREIGRDLDMILEAVFPSQYSVGITMVTLLMMKASQLRQMSFPCFSCTERERRHVHLNLPET